MAEEVPCGVIRRVTRLRDGFPRADPDQQILVADSGNDQTLVTFMWTVLYYTGRLVVMTGTFAGRSTGQRFPVVQAAAKIIDAEGKEYAGIANEALYDDNAQQVEALLSIHQSLANSKNAIDDRARCKRDLDGKPGRQASRFGQHLLPFHFDGSKCFYEVCPISEEELSTLPRVFITSTGLEEYEPAIRTHTTRATTAAKHKHLAPWKQRLAFVPDHVVDKTLKATTQLVATVEAETREHMRDHLLTRLPELKV